jgi:ubiquinone/menaquinone biosynthesis C-methylase UbiE
MISVSAPLRYGVDQLAHIPWFFDRARSALEDGYRGQLDFLSRHFDPTLERVLDCGCGTGIFSRCFSSRGYFGIDIAPDYVERARSQFPRRHFQVMDASCLSFPDHSFDCVLLSGVIHHVSDQVAHRILSEIHRVLRPEGALLMWEDVPTRSMFNVVGHLVHRLDVGDFIRNENSYIQLLERHFNVATTESLVSGWMDYVAVKALPKSPRA